jgi:catechol 2,3-dioxygenase
VARLFTFKVRNSPTDHIMTKSTCLNDLEGNGIELYAESPEDGSFVIENEGFATTPRARHCEKSPKCH